MATMAVVNSICPHCNAGLPSSTTEGIVWHHTAVDAPYTCTNDPYTVKAIERVRAIIDGRKEPVIPSSHTTINPVQRTENGVSAQ